MAARWRGINRSGTPYINVRGRQGRGPSLWEGLWPQRIVGPAVGGASGCRWLVRLARCLASLPSSRKTVVSHSRILEKFLANPNIRSYEATSCRTQPRTRLDPFARSGILSPGFANVKNRLVAYFRRISKRDETRFISLISQFLRHYRL